MAYYSDVRIILNKEDFEELDKIIKESKLEQLKEYSIVKLLEDDKYVYFGWDAVVWKLGCIDVQEWVVDREEYHFVRMGDDVEDIEDYWKLFEVGAVIEIERKFVE